MWFYAKDGRKAGPVSDGELDSLAASGVIDASTLVWKEGLAEWLPLATARPGKSIPKMGQEACSQCGAFHSPDDLVALSGLKVCGACKPAAVQHLKEGVTLESRDRVWRDGKIVVVNGDYALPLRCFRCNNTPISHTSKIGSESYSLELHAPAVHVHLCRECRAGRIWLRLIFISLGIAGVVLGAIIEETKTVSTPFWIELVGLVVVSFAIGATYLTWNVATSSKSANGFHRVAGAGKPFLDSLPERPN